MRSTLFSPLKYFHQTLLNLLHRQIQTKTTGVLKGNDRTMDHTRWQASVADSVKSKHGATSYTRDQASVCSHLYAVHTGASRIQHRDA